MTTDLERWIQKTLSRTRRSGRWENLIAREECWRPEVFSALVEEVDGLLLEGSHHKAEEIATHLPGLAKRIRPENCGGDVNRRSLEVWALAVRGSVLRAIGENAGEAQVVFERAFQHGKRGITKSAGAELHRRFGFYLLHRGDCRALKFLNIAVELARGQLDVEAECVIIRGICRGSLGDSAGALLDFSAATLISDPKRSKRSGWSAHAALHNAAFEIVKGYAVDIGVLEETRQFLRRSRGNLGPTMGARKSRCLWVEGLLVFRIGFTRHGERLLERARQSFLKLGLEQDYALVTVDLVVMLVLDGEDRRARQIWESAREVIEKCLESEFEPGFLLRMTFDLAGIRQVRECLAGMAGKPGPEGAKRGNRGGNRNVKEVMKAGKNES